MDAPFEHLERPSMSRVFAYCRVSTSDQNTENQTLEIATAGFSVPPSRIASETVSGKLDRFENGCT